MPKYRYLGDRTAIAIPTDGKGETTEVALIPNTEVELPADMPYVERLVAKGKLVAIATAEVAIKPRTRKEPSA